MSTHKTRNGIIAIAAVAVVLAGGYWGYRHFFLPKSAKVKYLITSGFYQGSNNGAVAFLMTLDDAYINDWYKAAKKGDANFSSGGKTFVTKGGWAATS